VRERSSALYIIKILSKGFVEADDTVSLLKPSSKYCHLYAWQSLQRITTGGLV